MLHVRKYQVAQNPIFINFVQREVCTKSACLELGCDGMGWDGMGGQAKKKQEEKYH